MNELSSLAEQQDHVPVTAKVFLSVLKNIRHGHLQVTIPDGTRLTFGHAHSQPVATMSILDWRACGRILSAGDIGFAEAFRQNWIDTPDLTALLRLAIRNEDAFRRVIFGQYLSRLWYACLHALRRNSRKGSKRNIHAHYDLGNAFYALWLDSSWTYSSALFSGDFQLSLEAAQAAKYQRIIDQLDLHAGDHVLEIGCGWGGFALHAAKQGIRVTGITISQAQYEIAVSRIRKAGLSHLAKIELRDYRDLQGKWDAIVSIEMFEAVGEAFWETWFNKVHALLKPGGKAVVQSITIDDRRFQQYRAGSDFIREYVFPGGMLPSPEKFIRMAKKSGLTTRDNYAFGADYAETLRRWRSAFERSLQAIRAQGFDEPFLKIWRLYLCYCEAGFDEGRIDVNQFVLSHTLSDSMERA